MEPVAAELRHEAERTNERRLLVLTGTRESTYGAARRACAGGDIRLSETTVLSRREILACEHHVPERAANLLGTTRDAVVVDCHDACQPNAIGRAVGAVRGGGLLVLLAPPFDQWPAQRDGFDERLAAPPATVEDVTGRFRSRLIDTLRAHPGVAIVDVNAGQVVDDGLTGWATPVRCHQEPEPDALAAESRFPVQAFESCLTPDQARAVSALDALAEPGNAVVVEADRGRGKSSAAGLAAGALAADGHDVLVTASDFRRTREVFIRATALLEEVDANGRPAHTPSRLLRTGTGGRVRFCAVPDAVDLPGDPDVVIVDEAAGLPVHRLEHFLAAPSVAFTTTVRGYEGAGRGFAVRFRERLDDSDLQLTDVSLVTPIRYAPGDPIEVWAFRALLLGAGPPVDQLVLDADPASVSYRQPSAQALLADEHLLREVFGLLVLAHYRTEPDDLARVLDAPNLAVRTLIHDGHVVAVALVATEGGLAPAIRQRMAAGERIRGNMIPDILAGHLRDEHALETRGWRVVRIATHPACRSQGFGSKLLTAIRREAGSRGLDWLGAGFGATPDLVQFWRRNGYGAVHVSTTRNDTSGEYSAVMLDPLTEAGDALYNRHSSWFADRIAAMCTDPLRDADPDVIRAILEATDATTVLGLSPREWTLIASAATGPARFSTNPRPFRRLAVRYLTSDTRTLDAATERLLVMKVLQGRPASAVAETLTYPSRRECLRELGTAYAALVRRFGTDDAIATLDKYE